MKNLLLIVLPLFLFSCKSGVESHRAAIEGLSTNWDATTTAVTEFANALSNEVNSYNSMAEGMAMSEDDVKKLKADGAANWAAATASFSSATTGYGAIQTELTDFVSMWTEKSATMESLKSGLAAGKIEGDVQAQIDELTALVNKGTENLAAWQARQAEVKAGADTAAANLKTTYESLKM